MHFLADEADENIALQQFNNAVCRVFVGGYYYTFKLPIKRLNEN